MKCWSKVLSLIMVVVICFSLVCSSVGAANINVISYKSKIDSYLSEKLETASSNELIPVHIWYKDIDQNLVEQSVEKECGFTKEELAIDYEMPSVELIASYKNGDTSSKSEMSNYMKRTEKLRLKEKERTDKYVMTRRNISRIKYNDKFNKIIKDLVIRDDKIVFRSEYAPTFIAELTKNEIERLKKDNTIESIGYYVPFECFNTEESADNVVSLEKNVSGISQVNDTLGLTGDGVKIGMYEAYCVNPSHEAVNNANIICRDYTCNDSHSINVARIMVGDVDGVSKNATLYSARNSNEDSEGDPTATQFQFAEFEWLVSQGVSIINLSFGLIPKYDATQFPYTFPEKWIDHLVAYHHITVVTAAGNNGDIPVRVVTPAMAHNVITVGGYITNFTEDTEDDRLGKRSSWANSGPVGNFEYVGLEKPDVIMPENITKIECLGEPLNAVSQFPDTYSSFGTSFAAPLLTASIALMLELKPSLSAFPQAIKAIVLASCHRKVGQSERNEPAESIAEGITECQGAGVPDIWTMACIVSQGSYGVAVLDSSQKIHRFYQPNYGATKMNVSLCWMRENYRINEGSGGEYMDNTLSVGPYINLDLYVKSNGIQHTSLNSNSSTEMAYFDMNSNNNVYELTVKRNSDYSYAVRYGYAYSTNEPYYTPITNDGIYKIKNLMTNEYMTLDITNNELIMEDYSDSDTKQDWLVKTSTSGGYTIISTHNSIQGAVGFGEVCDEYSKKIELKEDSLRFSLFSWDNMSDNQNYGAFRFYTRTGSSEWYIGCDDNNALLSTNISSLLSSYWILEKQNYRLGDANADGTIDILDKTIIQFYLAYDTSLDNRQMFLADIDQDGEVTLFDVSQIEAIYS